jgi:hypothetical protein
MNISISNSFIICFNLDLDQNIGLGIMYLPFGNHLGLEFIMKFQMLFMFYC